MVSSKASDSASLAAEDDRVPLPEIVGADLLKAKQNLNDPNGFFEKTLVNFLEEYENAPQEVAQFIKDADSVQFERYAHTFRGLAATLGLMELANYTAQIEGRLSQGEQIQQADELIELFIHHHSYIWSSLETYRDLYQALQASSLQELADDKVTYKTGSSRHSDKDWQEVKQQLNQYLEDYSGQVNEYHLEKKQLIRQRLSGSDYMQFEQYIYNFDFDEAIEILNKY